ncbi:VanR-ABDEGLN family DNA-binding response regulator [Paenibacillus albiflavus]|uniref:VanR-ABDEGLN family DNA-binding response regulator n=1 Tax=Paenibacillus albiflavus TaxID=2545760 RepID=A0A4R4ECH3_9BACL|nr:VanR-ABDEGLN family response regulator transcription factor [Paenibacillus albiflavus]TCZ77077.1 VanR-ABDEGLN family DNA-binding response regulator [Paenibacillus albiflavus]
MPINILVVDDEKEIADLLEIYLTNENYTVYKFYSAKEAMQCIQEHKMDLAILDVMLPDGDGFSMCQEIRKNHLFPIIMLTAKDHESDKIIGLTFGADDYITKPFRPLEVIARVKAQLRRYTRYNTEPSETDNLLVHRGLAINVKTHEAILDGIPMNLTPTEFLILNILCEENGNVVSSEQLFHRIWGDEYFVKNNNSITTHIRHLREKLGDSVENPKYIKTVWGVGYKLEK